MVPDMDDSYDVYRVTVRGRFVDLTDRARRFLESFADDHDIFSSAFTDEGTLTYDERLLFFNLRYEVRAADSQADAEAFARAEATQFLTTLDIGHTLTRVTSMNMTGMTRR
jgi:hypothetical protein